MGAAESSAASASTDASMEEEAAEREEEQGAARGAAAAGAPPPLAPLQAREKEKEEEGGGREADWGWFHEFEQQRPMHVGDGSAGSSAEGDGGSETESEEEAVGMGLMLDAEEALMAEEEEEEEEEEDGGGVWTESDTMYTAAATATGVSVGAGAGAGRGAVSPNYDSSSSSTFSLSLASSRQGAQRRKGRRVGSARRSPRRSRRRTRMGSNATTGYGSSSSSTAAAGAGYQSQQTTYSTLERAASLPPPKFEMPTYILEESLSSQELWHETAGRRPKQPSGERKYFEKLWAENFSRSEVDYSGVPVPSNAEDKRQHQHAGGAAVGAFASTGDFVSGVGEIRGNKVVLNKGNNLYGAAVSKSFDLPNSYMRTSPSLISSLTIQLPQFRVVREAYEHELRAAGHSNATHANKPTDPNNPTAAFPSTSTSNLCNRSTSAHVEHAEFLVVVTMGNVTYGIWRRFTEFKQLANRLYELQQLHKTEHERQVRAAQPSQAQDGSDNPRNHHFRQQNYTGQPDAFPPSAATAGGAGHGEVEADAVAGSMLMAARAGGGGVSPASTRSARERDRERRLPLPFKNTLLSWQCLIHRQHWFRCLDKEYLALKCFLLERFVQDLLFESRDPDILIDFLGIS